MQEMPSSVSSNLGIVIPLMLTFIGAVVVYLVLMVRTVVDMLRHDIHGAFLAFALLALIPFPPFMVLGITILIIWRQHKRGEGASVR